MRRAMRDRPNGEQRTQMVQRDVTVSHSNIPVRNPNRKITKPNVERSLARMKAKEREALGQRY